MIFSLVLASAFGASSKKQTQWSEQKQTQWSEQKQTQLSNTITVVKLAVVTL